MDSPPIRERQPPKSLEAPHTSPHDKNANIPAANGSTISKHTTQALHGSPSPNRSSYNVSRETPPSIPSN
eukprot:621006-Ditylum_brightwellii.AAC.1